eukprot:Awhi_evm1s2889
MEVQRMSPASVEESAAFMISFLNSAQRTNDQDLLSPAIKYQLQSLENSLSGRPPLPVPQPTFHPTKESDGEEEEIGEELMHENIEGSEEELDSEEEDGSD